MYYDNRNPFDTGSYKNLAYDDAKRTFSRLHLSLFVYLAAAFIIGIIVEIVVMTVFKDSAESIVSNIYYQWIMGVMPMYVVGLPLLYLIVKDMPKKEQKKSKLKIEEFLILFAISQALMYIGNAIGNTFNGFFGSIKGEEITNSTSELIENSPVWLTIIIAVILGPVVEEFVFRKLMIERLSRFGNGIAIVVSSVAFGLFHGNFYQFFYSALLGAVLGYIAVKTGNWI